MPNGKPFLDYAARPRRKRYLHRVYLAVTLTCFAIAAFLWYVVFLRTLPPGLTEFDSCLCCGIGLFGFFGLLFLYGAFAGAARMNEGNTSSRYGVLERREPLP